MEKQEILKKFPSEIRRILDEIINNDKSIISASDAKSMAEIWEKSIESLMLELLPLASLYSRPPISNFKVGVISQGGSGKLYFGANTEFLKQPMSVSIHGEQSSINNAWLNGETEISSIAVNYSPCGYCRQFLNELNNGLNIKILLPERTPESLNNLLPNAFGPKDLGLKGGLMKPQNYDLQLENNTDDILILNALDAAKKSYAPYSYSLSGIAIETNDKKIFKGQYAENAAFNPTLLPIQSALANINLRGKSYQDIKRVVLIEMISTNPLCSQIDITRSLLKSISSVDLEIFYAI